MITVTKVFGMYGTFYNVIVTKGGVEIKGAHIINGYQFIHGTSHWLNGKFVPSPELTEKEISKVWKLVKEVDNQPRHSGNHYVAKCR